MNKALSYGQRSMHDRPDASCNGMLPSFLLWSVATCDCSPTWLLTLLVEPPRYQYLGHLYIVAGIFFQQPEFIAGRLSPTNILNESEYMR